MHTEPLIELLKIPSVSAIHQSMEECAQKVEDLLKEADFVTRTIQTEGHPVVYGEKKGKTDKTLLFYDHYDVQPPDPMEEWISPPFEPEIRENRLYARGVADNKGNFMARLEAVKAFDELPITIKFVVEGEEEIGSPSLESFVKSHKEMLKADACIWEAGYKDEAGKPSMFLGTKGLCYVELRARAANRDLHSANAVIVENPAWTLLRALQTLKDPHGHILISGFYDDVVPPAEEDLEVVNAIPFEGDKVKKIYGITHFLRDMTDREAVYQLVYGCSCNICGIVSGYTGEGSKTVLPSRASVKIDFRLVPRQDPQKIHELLKKHLEKHGFSLEIVPMGFSPPAHTPVKERFVSVVKESMDTVYDQKAVIYPTMSGSGPMWLFTDFLRIPTVSIGVGDAESHAHSPNESIHLKDYEEGIEVAKEIIRRV